MKDFLSAKSSIEEKNIIAKLLQRDTEALEKFERKYQERALRYDNETDNLFDVNSRMASTQVQRDETFSEEVEQLIDRIVKELVAQTFVCVYDGNQFQFKQMLSLPENSQVVTAKEILHLPKHMRPELSGNLIKKDIPGEPALFAVMMMYEHYLNGKTPKERQCGYARFRQGLDILDLDEGVYDIIGTNPNSMGKWLPALVKACENQSFFKIPATTVVKVPLPLLQLTRLDYFALTPTTFEIVDRWAKEVFSLDENKDYFIKTGTYSSKFDFRNAHVCEPQEIKELGQYLLYIHFQALQMASPLSKPCIYGVSTTNEWVVRDFIADKENNPCIYHGMPLHTEYRVFVDCDSDSVIGMHSYWDASVMKNRFANGSDSENPNMKHDYVIYSMHEPVLTARYNENYQKVQMHIQKLLPKLNLDGQWSIDVMQNGEEFWIIDMARAENSAFYECVPEHLRRKSEEKWIPEQLV